MLMHPKNIDNKTTQTVSLCATHGKDIQECCKKRDNFLEKTLAEFDKLWKKSWKEATKMDEGFVSDEQEYYFIGNLPTFKDFLSSALLAQREELREKIKNLDCPLPKIPNKTTTPFQIGFQKAQELTIKILKE